MSGHKALLPSSIKALKGQSHDSGCLMRTMTSSMRRFQGNDHGEVLWAGTSTPTNNVVDW
eukprot:2430931-Amphidinium_carterae.1